MIPYHGGPVTPTEAAAALWMRRHACISYERPEQVGLALSICQSVMLDNGAFSAWRKGHQYDFDGYAEWVSALIPHPAVEFFLIPDIIDGDEARNRALVDDWGGLRGAVPVWHLHESIAYLSWLVSNFPRVALGSSGEYRAPGSFRWWARMAEAMGVACDAKGRPRTKLHGLRMLNPGIFSNVPLSSADSTNVARNLATGNRWSNGYGAGMTKMQRALVIAERIELHDTASRWSGAPGIQQNLDLIDEAQWALRMGQ